MLSGFKTANGDSKYMHAFQTLALKTVYIFLFTGHAF